MTSNERKLEQAKFALKWIKFGVAQEIRKMILDPTGITAEGLEHCSNIVYDAESRVTVFEDKVEEKECRKQWQERHAGY